MQYLFSLNTAHILVWPLRVPRGCRVLSGDDGIYVTTKRSLSTNGNSSIINIPLFSGVGHSIQSALDEFLSFRNVFALLRSPICGRIDIFMRSAYIAKNLTEKGTLPHECEIVRILRTMSYQTNFIPHSVLATAALETPGVQMEEEENLPALPRLETFPMPMFKIAEQFWDTRSKEFTKFPRLEEAKESPNVSLFYLPVKKPTSLALPLLKTLVAGIKEQPTQGKRVNCILLLDDTAAVIDTRLLTPETLSTLGVLVMSTNQYVKWATPPTLRRTGFASAPLIPVEDSLQRRSALFRSGIDFRFTPWPCDYHWKMFACGSSGMDYTVPRAKADWHCLLLNSCALDYASGRGLSQPVMDMLRDSERWPLHIDLIETWQHLDASSTRINPPFKFSVHVHTQEFLLPAEKTLERKVRSISTDAYFASFGYLWNSHQKKWCDKAFNRSFLRSPGNVISAEHIEACFDGFMKESAQKLLDGKSSCPICDEPANRLLQGCGHMYCNTCLRSIQEASTDADVKCPECRCEFLEEDIVEIKAQKTRRPRAGKEPSKELMLSRQKALRDQIPIEKGPMQIDTEATCIIVAFNMLIDKVREWAPGVHVASLETLGPRSANPIMSPIFSKIVLLSPHIPGVFYLESLHEIMQSWTTPEFELHILRLSNGAFSEDMDAISSVAKSYNVKI
jgi:hypothetical protein